VLWRPDSVAPEAEWTALCEGFQAHPAQWMLWEAEPARENRQCLDTIGIERAVFTPCANRPAQGDLLDAMTDNIQALRRVFGN
jgi:zinc transport system substrate-binding protein